MPALVVAAALYFAGDTALVLIGNMIYSSIQARRAAKQAKDAYNAAQKDREVTISLVDAPRSRIYGRVRNADGILFKGTYGDKKQYLQMVVALANHEVDAIETVYFGDVPLALDGNGYVLDKPWNLDTREPFVTTVTLDSNGNASYQPSASGIWAAAQRELDPQSVSAYTQIIRNNGDGTWGNPVPVSVVSGTVYVSGGPSLAGQTATLSFQGSAAQSKARVRKFTGAPGQDLSSYLVGNFPSLIQSGKHRFEGVACLLVDLEYNQDAFSQGIPHITAVMRGAKITDRRTGVTAWTQNPSVIGDDWARYAYGGGADDSELDAASFITAANACDVTHIFNTRNQDGVLFQTIRPMYTCGIALDTTADAGANFAAIVESMAGQWAWAGGRLRVRAGAYSTPVASIDESWCSGQGDIEIVATQPRSERVNVITPTIYNSGAHYTRAPLARVPAAAYIELDGQELPEELSFEGVTDVDHASHICGVMMREARQALTLKLPCKFKAYPLEVFDVVSVTLPRFGFAAKAFEVMATEMTQTGGVVLTLKETDASIFDPDAEFTREDLAPNTALPEPFSVPTLSIASISSGTAQLLKQADGTIVSRMLVTWAAIQDQAVREGGAVEVIARRIGTTEQVVETVAGTETQAYVRGVLDGNGYAVTIRARNKLVAGLPSIMVGHVVVGKTAAPSAVTGLSAAIVPGALKITRSPSPDPDYDHSVYRYGASWAAGTAVPGQADRTGITWDWPAPGTYTIWAMDVDTSGNPGTPVSFGPVTVTAAALAPANAALSIRINTDNFAGSTNYNECYIHGHDAAGNAVDAPGAILVNGVATAVPNGTLYTNRGPAAGWIVLDLAGATFAMNGGLAPRPYALVRRYQGTWQYDNNGSDWVTFDPSSTHVPIGTLETGAVDAGAPGSPPGVVTASIWAAASTLNATTAVADAAYAVAASAQAAASDAQTDADAALGRIAAIDSDGVLSRGEKPAVMKAWQAIYDEHDGIYAQASAYGMTALRDAWHAKFGALGSYLGGLAPAWNDATTDTAITAATDQAKWADYYAARQALLNAIADEAAKRATWPNVTGDGRPADNATADVVLVADGAVTVTANTVVKTGAGGWNASVRSLNSFTGGAFVSWVNADNSRHFVIGLNADPTTNAHYNTIDAGLYSSASELYAYSNGSAQNGGVKIGDVANGDVLAVLYDGVTVRYLRNGAVLFSQAMALTAPLFLDSSFDTTGAKVTNIQFGPLTSVATVTAAAAQAIQDAADAQATADGKITSFHQDTPPSGQGESEGDLWYDTNDGNLQYRYTTGVWVIAADTRIGNAITAASNAQNTANSKTTTFYGTSTPTALAVGDLWSNTTAGSTRLSRWNGSGWVVLNVIGTGDVDTDQLAPGAATVTLTSYVAGPVTDSNTG